MNAKELPLNQPVIIATTEIFRTTATRVSDSRVEIVYHDQQTNDEVLRMHGQVNGSSSELISFDKVYWNVSVNGRPATETDLQDLPRKIGMSLAIDPGKRSISVTVK